MTDDERDAEIDKRIEHAVLVQERLGVVAALDYQDKTIDNGHDFLKAVRKNGDVAATFVLLQPASGHTVCYALLSKKQLSPEELEEWKVAMAATYEVPEATE